MKIRTSFVSNSSSSSFIIYKAKLTHPQKLLVENYVSVVLNSNAEDSDCITEWTMEEFPDRYEFYTYLDNFTLDDFFRSENIPIEITQE